MSGIISSMRRLFNHIGGASTPSVTASFSEVHDPASEEVIALAQLSSAEDVDQAFRAADAAFQGGWGSTTPRERSEALWRIADAVERRVEEFADAESLDCGKPRATIVEDEISQSIDQIRFFAGAARHLEGAGAAEYLAGHTSYVRREPIGVVGQITPWNYPLNMAVWKIAPALAAGNTVVIKPAQTTPLSTLLLAEVAAEFLPSGALNVVLGDRATGEALTAHPTPQLVAVTGSVRAGMEVGTSAMRGMKRTHLELGGKAPAVVFADADLTAAVRGIAAAAYFNGGQDCTAATRVLVHRDVHAAFLAALVGYVEREVGTGAPDDGAFYGPMNSERQLESVLGVLARLPPHARVVTGGGRVDRPGYFVEPTVLDGMRQDDEAVQEEIFGPVLTVQIFDDEAEAVSLANGVRYALAASVWTADHGTAMRLTRDLDFGCVWVNTHIPFVSEMPHGGFKHSGYGKDLSRYGFEDYTRLKHVMHFLGNSRIGVSRPD